MRYDDEFVKRVTASVLDERASIREASRIMGIARNTIATWVKRTRAGVPARMMRAAQRVWNRTAYDLLTMLHQCLAAGKTVIQSWQMLEKQCSIRTIERWNAVWFPTVNKKKPCKRYVRKKAFSLMHTDWGVQRILDGQRTCFTFYEDDATRGLYALKAYKQANQENTNHCLQQAWQQTGGFKAVLSDCGKVYTKNFGQACGKLGTKSIHTRPYNPQCNGKAEAVVKKVKTFLKKHTVRDLDHMNALLAQFEHEYNDTPHSGLKYLTPHEVFKAKQRTGSIWAVG